ncbi:EAL domain-containing protein [Asanoa iriomotensis]|uniref:EAL domain-containing protein (Putative c-di-GMP-specific phosphodiesterase class I) n=1 Tax=Asanoa iriomotensis TaxID=234613 RepID=A0ABQ4CBC2_9ACTN|nr:EAL domain-containing protein [Asanoa iriomotensis]GIF60069.1 hypothetical protein Air01nite_61640 [Asanoa iriomotensis]
MDLDELVALARTAVPNPLERARARRAMRRIADDRRRRLDEGREILTDVDLHDPLLADLDEAQRIRRAADLRRRGTITWATGARWVTWTDEMARIFDRAPTDSRASLAGLFRLVHATDRGRVRRAVHDVWRRQSAADVVCRIIRGDGSTGYVEFLVEVTTDGRGRTTGIIATGHDVTAAHKDREETGRRALRAASVQQSVVEVDQVTGLLTRKAFADEVGRALRTGTGTLLVISASPYISRSSDVESGRDHRLSAATARLLREAFDALPCGALGRHEFGVLLPYTTFETATRRAEEVISSLRQARYMADCPRIDAFGGLVRYDYRLPVDSMDLLVDADGAWRRAKHEDRPLHVLRQPPSADERREMCRNGIRSAVDQRRFILYAQPLRDLELNRTTRHEILLRVLDEAGRPTLPTTFLELAEHVDEILAVDKWVLDRALRLIGERRQTSHFQINVSGRSLGDALLGALTDAIERYGVDPTRLTIEITETAAIGNLTVARRFADGVRELGCQVALDDFGTGNTPLGFLTKLPVDLVKIDGSFIAGIAHSAAKQAVVQGLVQMCASLGILTAAECVQDDATIDLLRVYGVDFAQGFHVGEPSPLLAESRPAKQLELEVYPVASASLAI